MTEQLYRNHASTKSSLTKNYWLSGKPNLKILGGSPMGLSEETTDTDQKLITKSQDQGQSGGSHRKRGGSHRKRGGKSIKLAVMPRYVNENL